MLSTRRAIEGFAAPEHWEFLLQYRYELKGKCPDNPSILAWFWLEGTDDGRRLHRFLRWAGTLRVNRRHRPGSIARELYSELYRTVRRMQSSLRDEPAFRFHGQEAQIIFDRARLNYLMPIAKEALEAKRKGRAGAKDRQELIDTVYLRHRASIAAAVAVVLRRAGRNVPRKALIAWLSLEQGVWPLVAELRCATGNDDAQLEPKRLLRLFPELFPGSRGPRRSPLSPRNE